MIDCVHYFGHLLPFGVSEPGFVSPCSHSDTLEAISWLFQLMSGGLFPDDAAEWCKIPLQGFLNHPFSLCSEVASMTHCPCFHGSRWKLLSVTALPLCSPHLLLLLRGPLLRFENPGRKGHLLLPLETFSSVCPQPGSNLLSLSSSPVFVSAQTAGCMSSFSFSRFSFNIPGGWSHGMSIDGFFMSQLRQL